MPIWLTLGWGILKSLLTGEFMRLWGEHKEREADNVESDVNSDTDTDVVTELRKWTRNE